MKGLGMNRMLSTLKRRTTPSASSSVENVPPPSNDSPEAAAFKAVKHFCSDNTKSGDEVLYLPTIVDAAESSPAAAAECARLIRKYLARSYIAKPSCQYNAIMLIRILSDNPGPTFTRNFDRKFVDVVRDLLKVAKDRSVLNLLMETLDSFEYTKVGDEGLTPLIRMWKNEKEKTYKNHGYTTPPLPAPPQLLDHSSVNPQDIYFTHSPSPSKLPPPEELASRLEEAITSAKLLTQFVTSSTAQELLASDLVREFASRCQSASKSIQTYMAAEDPAPDNDTMESLLDANEQVQTALNTHQRAALSAKKSLGISAGGGTPTPGTPSPELAANRSGSGSGSAQGSSSRSGSQVRRRDNGKGREDAPLPDLPPRNTGKGREDPPLPELPAIDTKGKGAASYEPPPGPPPGREREAEDPFRDPDTSKQEGSSFLGDEMIAFDSFHPGFTPAGSGSASGPKSRDDDASGSGPAR